VHRNGRWRCARRCEKRVIPRADSTSTVHSPVTVEGATSSTNAAGAAVQTGHRLYPLLQFHIIRRSVCAVRNKPCWRASSTAAVHISSGSRERGGWALRHSSSWRENCSNGTGARASLSGMPERYYVRLHKFMHPCRKDTEVRIIPHFPGSVSFMQSSIGQGFPSQKPAVHFGKGCHRALSSAGALRSCRAFQA